MNIHNFFEIKYIRSVYFEFKRYFLFINKAKLSKGKNKYWLLFTSYSDNSKLFFLSFPLY